jgi:hypothetical protein
MGAFKGNVTVRRYLVPGEPPREQAKLMKGIRAHAFLPIDPKTDVERAHGWAVIEDPSDVDLSADKVFFSDVLALALRVDTLRPPAAVVKRLALEKIKALGRKPNRAEQQAAREEVKRQLRGRYHPTTRATDVIWQLDRKVVYFWSLAKGANELLVDHFFKSFGLELVPNGPGLVAGRGALPSGLEPTPEMVFGFPGLPGRATESTENADA